MSESKHREGIETDVLLYIDGRFDKFGKEQKEDTQRLYDKLDEISKVTNENLHVAKTQNSRIYKIEQKHENCPGVAANKKIEVAKEVAKVTSTNSYKIGEMIKIVSITSGLVITILGLFDYLKDRLL